MANLKFDQEITALLGNDSGNHLVCGGAVQAAGGGFMARLGRGPRGLGALVGHGVNTSWEIVGVRIMNGQEHGVSAHCVHEGEGSYPQ